MDTCFGVPAALFGGHIQGHFLWKGRRGQSTRRKKQQPPPQAIEPLENTPPLPQRKGAGVAAWTLRARVGVGDALLVASWLLDPWIPVLFLHFWFWGGFLWLFELCEKKREKSRERKKASKALVVEPPEK